MSDIRFLYQALLSKEYRLGMLGGRADLPGIKAVFAHIEAKSGGSIEDKIRNHPDRPKTADEALRLKQEIIQQQIDLHQKNIGLCYSCEHYLPAKKLKAAAEELRPENMARIMHGLDSEGRLCNNVDLDKEAVPLLICPHYAQTRDLEQVHMSLFPSEKLAMWEALQRKYGRPPEPRQPEQKKPRF